MGLKKPTAASVGMRLAASGQDDPYFRADAAIRIAFERWPENIRDGEVLAKVTLLNTLYSTRIMDVYPVVNHIMAMKIDNDLRLGHPTLVGRIANVRFRTRCRICLSFASKYCAWHQPERFQIFDSFVVWILSKYRREYGFAKFSQSGLRDYPTYMATIEAFRTTFGLEAFSRKQIDKFLWLEAKREMAKLKN